MAVKFSDAEAAVIDAARGEVSRSEWLRTVALAAAAVPVAHASRRWLVNLGGCRSGSPRQHRPARTAPIPA